MLLKPLDKLILSSDKLINEIIRIKFEFSKTF